MRREKAIELLERANEIIQDVDSLEADPIEICAIAEALKGLIPDALALLKQPKCKTCGGSGEIRGAGGFRLDCPDCQQPEHIDWDIKEWPYQTHLRAKTRAEHLEQIRCLFGKELEQPKCETCGGSRKKYLSAFGGVGGKEIPCPDCQQPEPTEFIVFRKKLGEALGMKGLLGEDVPPTEFILAELDRQAARIKELEKQPKPTDLKQCIPSDCYAIVENVGLKQELERQAARIEELETLKEK